MPSYALYIDWNNDGDFTDSGETISLLVLRAHIERGFADPLTRVAQTGHATFVLDNADKAFSPYLHGTVLPRRPVKYTMTHASITVTRFRGYTDSITPTANAWGDRIVTLECVDAMALLDAHEGAIALQQNAFADDIIDAVIDAVFTPASTTYDQGVNLFPLSADRWNPPTSIGGATTEKAAAARKIVEACMADWGRFYIAADGVPTFRNRHYELLNTTVLFAFNEDTGWYSGLQYRKGINTVYNAVEVQFTPRNLSDTLEVIGTYTPSPALRIEAGAARTVTVNFYDPSNRAARIGALGVLTPVATTDYTATADEGGYGTDRTSDITPSMTALADRAIITLTNGGGSALYVQTLQVRGYAVRIGDAITAIEESATSITAYQRRVLALNAALMSQAPEAQRLAEHLIARYATPQDEVGGVSVDAVVSNAHLAFARDLELLKRVTLAETQTGLTAWDGLVYHISETVTAFSHVVRFDVQTPYTLPAYSWVLGTSLLGEETYLGTGVKSPMRLDMSAFDDGHVIPY